MLVVVHHPITDVRAFVREDTGRLPRPVWSNPGSGDFVRGCGHLVRKGPGGAQAVGAAAAPTNGVAAAPTNGAAAAPTNGVAAAPRNGVAAAPTSGGPRPVAEEEDVFCGLEHALQFEENLLTYRGGVPSFPGLRCVFRRLVVMPEQDTDMAPGRPAEIVARAEIGLRLRHLRSPGEADLLAALTACLRVPARVPSGDPADRKRVSVLGAGPALASHLLRSTTRLRFQKGAGAMQRHWVAAGAPLVIVETQEDGPWKVGVPDAGGGSPAEWQRFAIPPGADLDVLHRTMQIGSDLVPVWLLRLGKNPDKDCARRLRTCLARMHTRREAANRVLRLIQEERLSLSPGGGGTPAKTDMLLDCIDRWRGELSRHKAYGFSQSDAQRLAYHYDVAVTGAERDRLLALLGQVRPDVAARVGRYTANGGRADGGGAVKVLFVSGSATPTGWQLAQVEERELMQTLERQTHRGAIDLVHSPAARLEDLIGNLQAHDPAVLHFASPSEDGVALLGDQGAPEVLAPDALMTLFEELGTGPGRKLRVVMLSRCYSPEQAAAVRAHIDFVVGTEAALDAAQAVKFVAGFYDNVGFGRPIASAFRLARLVVGPAKAITHFDPRDGTTPEEVRLVTPSAPDKIE